MVSGMILSAIILLFPSLIFMRLVDLFLEPRLRVKPFHRKLISLLVSLVVLSLVSNLLLMTNSLDEMSDKEWNEYSKCYSNCLKKNEQGENFCDKECLK